MANTDSITQDQYNSIIKRIDTLQKTIDRLYSDFQEDERDLSLLTERVGKIEAITTGTAESIRGNTRKIVDRVEDAISSNMQPLKDVKQSVDRLTIKNPKILFFERPRQGFFARLFGRTPKKE